MDQGVGGTSTRREERVCVCMCVCACGSVFFFLFQCGQQTLLELLYVVCRQQAHHPAVLHLLLFCILITSFGQ